MKKIKALVIDDSAIVRQTLTSILDTDPKIEVIATASDPYMAVKKIKEVVPDVITLDLEMPRMDGLTFLTKLMAQHPIPVLVISTLTEKGAESAIKALEYGAVEVITKPKVNTKELLQKSGIELCDKIKAAALAKVTRKLNSYSKSPIPPKLSADVIIGKRSPFSLNKTTEIVIAVGASTGGTEAIKELLCSMPPDSPGIVIVQHMPEFFTTQFAKRLNEVSQLTVKEATNGDPVLRGQALLAPGNMHILLKRNGANYYVEVKDGPLVNRHKPAVDVLFRSVAKYAGSNAIGVIMTGMGDDGAKGLLEMKEAGAHTIAQDESSCVVFGMPQSAIQLNAVNQTLPLSKISSEIIRKRKQERVLNII